MTQLEDIDGLINEINELCQNMSNKIILVMDLLDGKSKETLPHDT